MTNSTNKLSDEEIARKEQRKLNKRRSNQTKAAKKAEARRLNDRRWKAQEIIEQHQRNKSIDDIAFYDLEVKTNDSSIDTYIAKTYGNKVNASKIEDVRERADSDFEHSHLYVVDPDDLTELTVEEVRFVWSNRLTLCGSVEVAAEALAIMEIDQGIVESYQGWQSYVHHLELKELKDKLYNSEEVKDEVTPNQSLTLNSKNSSANSKQKELIQPSKIVDIKDKTHDEIKALWNGRPNSFSSIEVACEILARLRFDGGIDTHKKHWQSYLNHPEIKLIEDEYPEYIGSQGGISTTDNHNFIIPEQKQAHHNIDIDKRTSVTRIQKERKGQQSFRQLIMQAYRGTCNITECKEKPLLEAAHISPYMGEHSNILKNGLCLRVDIHRLFDKFLISINPEFYTLVVSASIQDKYYQSLNGKNIFSNTIKPSSSILKKHYKTFLKIEMQR